MRFIPLAAALLATAALPAQAQAQKIVPLAAGMVFYGPDGQAAGTIREVSGSAVVVDTGANIVTLGAESFVSGRKGPAIGYTREQLDAAIVTRLRDQEARISAALAVGAPLRGSDGKNIGTVRRINPDGSVVVVDGEHAFRIERAQLDTDTQGLVLRFSSAQLEVALDRKNKGS